MPPHDAPRTIKRVSSLFDVELFFRVLANISWPAIAASTEFFYPSKIKKSMKPANAEIQPNASVRLIYKPLPVDVAQLAVHSAASRLVTTALVVELSIAEAYYYRDWVNIMDYV